MRVTRQLFISLVFDIFGQEEAKQFHDSFRDYLIRVEVKCNDELYEQLHKAIYANREVFDETADYESAAKYCVEKFEWV